MKITNEIHANRVKFLVELRSGKYKKGCIKSDEKGNPIFENESDKDGCCACAIMIHTFPKAGKESMLNGRTALGLTAKECRYIQQELNDSDLSFEVIADVIEEYLFKEGEKFSRPSYKTIKENLETRNSIMRVVCLKTQKEYEDYIESMAIKAKKIKI